MEALKVSSKSNPNSVAGALAGVARSAGAVEIQVVGAGALNQAVKALAIARGYVAPSGLDLCCRPTFADIEIDGEPRTAIRLQIDCVAAISGRSSAAQHASPGASSSAAAAAGSASNARTASAIVLPSGPDDVTGAAGGALGGPPTPYAPRRAAVEQGSCPE